MMILKAIILDAGHGGLVNGNYVTQGKRSPIWNDGSVYYEGVGNRLIREELCNMLISEGVNVHYSNEGNNDLSLSKRARRINKISSHYGRRNVLGISIHSDAHEIFYIDKECKVRYEIRKHGVRHWKSLYKKNILVPTDANGWTCYTTRGRTKSDMFGEVLYETMKNEFPESYYRTDLSDGDLDIEVNHFITKNTICPMILSENFYMTNKNECKNILMTREGRFKIAKGHFNMIKKFL